MTTPSPTPTPIPSVTPEAAVSTPQPTYPVVVVDAPVDVPGLWVDGIGAAIGIAGFLLAIYFARRGAKQVRTERQITHELDVLRGLPDRAAQVGAGGVGMEALRVELLSIDDPTACPLLRVWADAGATGKARARFDEILLKANPDPEYWERARGHPSNTWSVVITACIAEIEDAIRKRLRH